MRLQLLSYEQIGRGTMQIKKAHYMATINLGNYSNEKVGFTAIVEDGETAEQVLEALRQKAKECALPNSEQIYRDIHKAQVELKNLERKLTLARDEWNKTAEFLRTQGIKTDANDMPQFTNLLPQVQEEHLQVSQGEIEDDNEDEDDEF